MDRFISYKKMKELQEASKQGNPQAKTILDKYMEDQPDMESIGRLLEEYYGVAKAEGSSVEAPLMPTPAKPEEAPIAQEEARPEAEVAEEMVDASDDGVLASAPEDISAILDKELDGVIDSEEISDYSMRDYLSDKKKNGLRAKKDNAYFKAFDADGRASYLTSKKDEFNHGFDGKRRDIERSFSDVNNALDRYSQFIIDMPDDDMEIDVDVAGKAYGDFTDDENAMSAFGRSWDDADLDVVKSALMGLVAKYGKKNVMAAMNTIRDDNSAWKQYANGKIDAVVSKYGKSLDDLLK